MKHKMYIPLLAVLALVCDASCVKNYSVRASKKTIPANASIGIIIDSPNNIKNFVMAKFMEKGYSVKAINASDLYTYENVYDIRDFKSQSYMASKKGDQAADKTDAVYKLHIYNYEINKAEMLDEIKSKWNVQYLVLFELNKVSVESWSRVIDLNSHEIMWVETYYPGGEIKTFHSIVEYFIAGMTSK